jgi:hypothetical protein
MKTRAFLAVGILLMTVLSFPRAVSAGNHESSTRPEGRTCRGVDVPAGADLASASASSPAGTTFCLAAGAFTISETVTWQPGDRVIGAGMGKTFIRPAGIGTPVIGFTVPGNTTAVLFSRFDIGGFQAEPSSTTCRQCGTAIVNSGGESNAGWTRLSAVRCHDNGKACVAAGTGNVKARRFDCYKNGFHQAVLLTTAYRSASCVKMMHGSMTMRHSFIHDNFWNGIWCDHCDHSTWVIEDSVFKRNGHAAIVWEISGQLPTDTAIVANNVIRNNGWQLSPPGSSTSAGLIITGGRNIRVVANRFGGNRYLNAPGGSVLSCCRAIRVSEDDRAPWDPDLQNVVIRRNLLRGDHIKGCSYVGVVCSANV